MQIISLLYLFLPSFVANMAPVVASRLQLLSQLDRPLDGGAKLNGKRVLGDHKTVRGVVVAVIAGLVTAWIAGWLAESTWLAPYNLWPFQTLSATFIFGVFAALGTMTGDSLKSFFKRQIGIGSGRPFIPFDQIDYILGTILFTWPLYQWTLTQSVSIIIFAIVANPIVNLIAYVLGIKKTYW